MTKSKTSVNDKKLLLTVTSRKVFGKKLKQLRKQGQIIGNIYGQDFKSQPVVADFKDFYKVYRIAKETGIVYIQIEKKEIPVLMQNLQKHPITNRILHVDFRKVDLSKKIETEVPVKIIGISEAVTQKGGVLLTQASLLKIEARPEDLPPQIEIDISILKDINQEIKVADLPKKDTYTINELQDKVIVSVVAHKEETIVPETTTTPPEIITEKEKTAEGEPVKEEVKKPVEEKSKPPAKEGKK